jgi:hypothetical protein
MERELRRYLTVRYLHTLASVGMPSVQSVHDYYPFALEDGGRLWRLIVWLFWWLFVDPPAWVCAVGYRLLRFYN